MSASPLGAPMSTMKSVLYVAAAFMAISLMGGAVYGWPSLSLALEREGALRSTGCEDIPADEPCNAQDLALGVVFTVGSWANQGGRLFVGIALDRLGPRWTSSLCSMVCGIGAVIFALLPTTTGLAAGYFCIGVGGAGMQLSLQSVSALFPKNKGLVMALLSGAFQAASGVFLLCETIQRFTDTKLSTLILIYAGLLLCMAVVSVVIWPVRPFGTKAAAPKKDTSSTASAAPDSSPSQDVEAAAKTLPEEVPLQERSYREQALSPQYLLMTTFFAFTVLQCQFTLGTIGKQFEEKGDDGSFARAFNLTFSLSWAMTPMVGMMIDRLGFGTFLLIMNTVELCSCIGLLFPWKELQIATSILYAVGRLGIWASFFGFNGFVFGFKNYGKLAGGGLFVASCLSLLQYPLLQLTLTVFKGNFAYVNTFFVCMTLALYPIIFRLSCHLNRRQPSKTHSVSGGTAVQEKEPKELAPEKVHEPLPLAAQDVAAKTIDNAASEPPASAV
eukprot:TRINITY_DN103655_c0_g1_i1.p1 TRINITY_DN103655_c0_g1~~TRINITY_DN103655_c0_g1_i1.p1  ORF type:complete len:518 (-),score=83.13 TRINITY_DN103655_c0_g1_i1:369-1871(-)